MELVQDKKPELANGCEQCEAAEVATGKRVRDVFTPQETQFMLVCAAQSMRNLTAAINQMDDLDLKKRIMETDMVTHNGAVSKLLLGFDPITRGHVLKSLEGIGITINLARAPCTHAAPPIEPSPQAS